VIENPILRRPYSFHGTSEDLAGTLNDSAVGKAASFNATDVR